MNTDIVDVSVDKLPIGVSYITAITEIARSWCRENVIANGLDFGPSVEIENRFVPDISAEMRNFGLVVLERVW